jgi:hypothetical protein
MVETIMAWTTHSPVTLVDWLKFLAVVLPPGVLMALIAFASGGRNPAAVMYRRSLSVAEDGYWGRGFKLTIFVLGETIFYQGIGMTYAVDYYGKNAEILVCALGIGIVQGFLPPHHHLPAQTRVAAVIGSFVLSLVFLKCGGWDATWASVRSAIIITFLAHLVPVVIITLAFVYRGNQRGKR